MKHLLLGIVALFGALTQTNAQGIEQKTIVIDSYQINQGYYTLRLPLKQYAIPSIQFDKAAYIKLTDTIADSLFHALSDYKVILGMERKQAFAFVQIPVYQFVNGNKQQLVHVTLAVQEPIAAAPARKLLKTTAAHSVLSQGDFYKISISKRGVYKVDYAFLKNTLGAINGACASNTIHLFGNGGTMLSEDNSVSSPDDLTENAIFL